MPVEAASCDTEYSSSRSQCRLAPSRRRPSRMLHRVAVAELQISIKHLIGNRKRSRIALAERRSWAGPYELHQADNPPDLSWTIQKEASLFVKFEISCRCRIQRYQRNRLLILETICSSPSEPYRLWCVDRVIFAYEDGCVRRKPGHFRNDLTRTETTVSISEMVGLTIFGT